jgi:hypothetical protein
VGEAEDKQGTMVCDQCLLEVSAFRKGGNHKWEYLLWEGNVGASGEQVLEKESS